MTDLNPDFLCICGHRNRMHITLEEALQNSYSDRICIEFKDVICAKGVWYHNQEVICNCNKFVGDNLLTLEQQSEKVV
jgi:hypothetical protein